MHTWQTSFLRPGMQHLQLGPTFIIIYYLFTYLFNIIIFILLFVVEMFVRLLCMLIKSNPYEIGTVSPKE